MVVTGRRVEAGEALVAELAATGAEASFLAGDVADIPAAQGTVAHLVILLLSEASAVVTGSIIDWDQNVPGAHD